MGAGLALVEAFTKLTHRNKPQSATAPSPLLGCIQAKPGETVRDAAKAKRRQELADDGEVTTLTYPPLRYGVRKGPMKVVTLLTNSPKQLNHLGNQQTACGNLGSRAGKAGGPFVASSQVCSNRDKPERVVHHQQRLAQ